MNAVRSRKHKAEYKKYLEGLGPNPPCQFCGIEKGHSQFVTETKYFKIILNIFPYTKWDTQPVTEHLMIIPKKHTDTLKGLSFAASKEYVDLVSEYEYEGYNIYARTPGSKMKSVTHQHTHLIKLAPVTQTKTIHILAKPIKPILKLAQNHLL